MKTLILSCLAAVSLITLAACSDDSNKSTMSSTDQTSSMQTDTKDMKPVQH
jgi:uncharacterized lipoprotein